MTALTVNGRAVVLQEAARAHLGDALREGLLLTGTHLGCEHGVCGACTVLLDGVPVRSCLTFAALCEGSEVRTIEGLEDDAVVVRLREAFGAEHALQCGYCTPGMLVTARDIVVRLPEADDDRVRLELAGNLCRCTGYNGIVRAIRRVLDERLEVGRAPEAAVPAVRFTALVREAGGGEGKAAGPGDGLRQRLRFGVAPAVLWAALRDPAAIAGSIPGAVLEGFEGERVTGSLVVAIGPVRARFRGEAVVRYDDAAMAGSVRGSGRDAGTAVTAGATFRVEGDGPGSVLLVEVEYAVRGPLALLAKPAMVAAVAGGMAAAFGERLSARLRGEDGDAAPLSAVWMLWRVVRGRVLGWLGRAPG